MEFSLYRSFPQALETEWNDLLAESHCHVPFMRYEYLQIWWETRGGGEWPPDAQLAIVVAREDGRLTGIAPLFFATWEGRPTLLLLGSIEISDYLDLIVRDADLPAFARELLDLLTRDGNGQPDWDRLDLYNVIETSPTLQALAESAVALGWTYTQAPFRPAMTLQLPGDWETYLASIDKKQRHEIRRKMRRAYNDQLPVRWYIARDPRAIDAEIEAFLHLMENDPEKAAFLTPPMRENFRLATRCAFDHDCLLLAFLEVDGVKAAAYLTFDYVDTLWVYNSGMNGAYNEYSPGWVLLGELLKWSIENGRQVFDFMRGDEDYKLRFGAKRREVMRLTVNR
jgi:CelD/BcsL family acetyltransferase involved in cellulose biosynthesis